MPALRSPAARFTLLWTLAQVAAALGILGTPHLLTPGTGWLVIGGYALAAGVALWGGRAMMRGDAPPAWLARVHKIVGAFRETPLHVGTILLILLWGGPWLDRRGETVSTLIRLGGSGLIALALYALHCWGVEARPDGEARAGRYVLILAGAILALAVILPLAAVADFPRVDDTDEPWNLNIGWTFAQSGLLHARLYQGAYGVPNTLLPTIYYGLGAWLKVFGLGLVQGRLYQLLWKGLLLVLIYDTTRRLYDRPSALLATAFAASSAVLFEFGLLVRGDVPLAATVALALWLHVLARQRARQRDSRGLHLLSGLVFGLSIQAHQNGLAFCAAFGLYYTLDYAAQLYRARRFVLDWPWLAFAAGGLLAGAAFLVVQYWPYRPFLADFQRYTAEVGYFLPITSGDPVSMLSLQWDRLLRYGRGAEIELPLAALAAFAAWWRGESADRRLLALLGLVALSYTAIVSSRSILYVVHPLALIAPLVGAMLWRGMGWRRERSGGRSGGPFGSKRAAAVIVTVALAALLGTGLGRLWATLDEGFNRRFFACAAQAQGLFSDEAMLYLDEPILWLAYPSAENYADHHVVDIWAATRGLSAAESLARLAPDVVLGMYGGRPEGVSYAQERGYVRLDATNGGVECWTMWVNPAVLAEPSG